MSRPLDFQINEERLDREADELVASLPGHGGLPIDPEGIARMEDITLVADNFGKLFDSRLEFDPTLGFVLYLNDLGTRTRDRRQRFSIGHELGHYYLHRHRLLNGALPHNSHVDFKSPNREEREADYFSASLLMPRSVFGPRANRRDPDLKVVLELSNAFDTSWTSTALRIVTLSHFPCALIVSSLGTVLFSFRSPPLIELGCGIGRVPKGSAVPPESITAKHTATDGTISQKDVLASTWGNHEREEDPVALEQVVRMGDRLLTLLSLDEDDLAPSEDDDEVDDGDRD